MENLQSEFFYMQGFRQDTLREKYNWSTVTRKTECEYLIPVGLFDEINMQMRIGHIGSSSFRCEFEMTQTSDGSMVARSSITLVTVDVHGKAIRIPDMFRENLLQWSSLGLT